MSLKSGLLTESTWVVNVLNILLCDNTMVAYFYLGHHPNLLRMLDRLLDHFQKVCKYFRLYISLHISPYVHDSIQDMKYE